MHAPSLFALMAPAPDSGSGGLMILLFQVAAIGLVFYFLIIRPQGQARKKHQELLAGLKKGDEIMTAGGIIGKVKDIKENKVTVEKRHVHSGGGARPIIQVGDAVAPASNALLNLHLLGSPTLRQESAEIARSTTDCGSSSTTSSRRWTRPAVRGSPPTRSAWRNGWRWSTRTDTGSRW